MSLKAFKGRCAHCGRDDDFLSLRASEKYAFTEEYEAALTKMAQHYDMSKLNVLRAAVRLYQAQMLGTVKIEHIRESKLADFEAPKVAAPEAEGMTDEQIVKVWQGMPGGPEGWLKDFGFLQFARAVLDATTPQVEPASAWLPIESAPKDGTQLILTNGETVAQGWYEIRPPRFIERRDMLGNYIDQDEDDGFEGWIDCAGGMQPDATHYMPLPAAPNLASQAPEVAP